MLCQGVTNFHVKKFQFPYFCYKYIQIYTNIYKYIQIYTNIYKYIQIYTNIYKYIHILKKLLPLQHACNITFEWLNFLEISNKTLSDKYGFF